MIFIFLVMFSYQWWFSSTDSISHSDEIDQLKKSEDLPAVSIYSLLQESPHQEFVLSYVELIADDFYYTLDSIEKILEETGAYFVNKKFLTENNKDILLLFVTKPEELETVLQQVADFGSISLQEKIPYQRHFLDDTEIETELVIRLKKADES